jgi:hypothetical protein
MPTTRSLLTFLALSPFTLVACGSSPEHGDARFAEMSSAERDNEISGASGYASVMPYFLVLGAEADNASNPDCPRREDGDGVVTFTADHCTTATGTAYDGRIVARNVVLFGDLFDPQVEASAPMEIELDAFSVGDLTFDGYLRQSRSIPAAGDHYTAEAAFTVSAAGTGSSSVDSSADCTNSDDGSECTLAGFIDGTTGSYGFDGELARGTTTSGSLELRGADTLRVDFDAAVGGCAPYTIDDTAAGTYCFADPTPEPVPPQIAGEGTSCDDINNPGWIDAHVYVRGDANIVTVSLDDGESLQTDTLDFVSYDDAADWNVWQASLETSIACGDENLTYKYAAYAVDGTAVCVVSGAHPEVFAADGCDVL